MRRLFDRLISERKIPKKLPAGSLSLSDAQVIVGDEIVEHADRQEDKVWTPDDFPNIAPPFNNFFFEGYSKATDCLMGAWSLVSEFTPKPFKQRGSGQFSNYERPADTRWGMAIKVYIYDGKRTTQLPALTVVHVSPEGKWLDKGILFTKDDDFGDVPYQVLQNSGEILANILAPMFLALSIFHCKNVEVIEVPPVEKLSKSHKKKYGNELVTYKTLRVKKNIKKNSAESKELSSTRKKYRGHMVHGHFKTYTEDAPLLGRAVGTYWWGAQLRGSFAEGAIVKEYKVSDE